MEKLQPHSNKSKNTSTETAIRVFVLILGLFGLLIFIPWLIAAIPVTILPLIALLSRGFPEQGLLIATFIIFSIIHFLIIGLGLFISGQLVYYFFKPRKSYRHSIIGILITVAVTFILFIAGTTTGGIWVSKITYEEAQSIYPNFRHSIFYDIIEEPVYKKFQPNQPSIPRSQAPACDENFDLDCFNPSHTNDHL